MKKLLLLCIALVAVLTSCANDDDSILEDSLVLPQTITYTYPVISPGTNEKNTLTFDGNKIVSIVEFGSKVTFTYSGDFIIKQEAFDVDQQGKETKHSEVGYFYENGKLKTRTFTDGISVNNPDGLYFDKTVYTYSSNELISYVNSSVDNNTKKEIKTSEGTLTYKGDNLVKDQQKFDSVTITLSYEYDTKYNPLKNILGFNLLLNEISEFGKNNIVKTIRTSSDNTNIAVYLTSYIYNESDYPTKHTSFAGDGKSIEYEIEYTY